MVNFRLILLVGVALAFVSAGGIAFTRNAVREAKKLKDDILPSSAKPNTDRIDKMTKSKLNDRTGGENV